MLSAVKLQVLLTKLFPACNNKKITIRMRGGKKINAKKNMDHPSSFGPVYVKIYCRARKKFIVEQEKNFVTSPYAFPDLTLFLLCFLVSGKDDFFIAPKLDCRLNWISKNMNTFSNYKSHFRNAKRLLAQLNALGRILNVHSGAKLCERLCRRNNHSLYGW